MRRLLMLVTVALCAFFSAAPALQTAVVMHSPVTPVTAVALSHAAGAVSTPQILCPNGMPLPC